MVWLVDTCIHPNTHTHAYTRTHTHKYHNKTGTWGFTFDPPYDLESRYDTFIRDVLLCGTPGLMFGIFFVSTMKIPTFLVSPMKSSWFETGRDTKKHHLKILFQMLVLKQITLIYNTDYGTNRFYPQVGACVIMREIVCV